MEIELPSGWSQKSGGVEASFHLAENQHGVVVGYRTLTPDRHVVWAGEEFAESKPLDVTCSSEQAAMIRALEFMDLYPDARWVSEDGVGHLNDSDGTHISLSG